MLYIKQEIPYFTFCIKQLGYFKLCFGYFKSKIQVLFRFTLGEFVILNQVRPKKQKIERRAVIDINYLVEKLSASQVTKLHPWFDYQPLFGNWSQRSAPKTQLDM